MQDLKLCRTISPNFNFTTEDLILWRPWNWVQELFGASPQADKQISSNPTPPSPPAPVFTYAEMGFRVSYKSGKHVVTEPHQRPQQPTSPLKVSSLIFTRYLENQSHETLYPCAVSLFVWFGVCSSSNQTQALAQARQAVLSPALVCVRI